MTDYSLNNLPIRNDETLKRLESEVTKAVVLQLIKLFVNETETLLSDLPEALEQQDQEQAMRILHSIKSGAKTYGADQLAWLSGEMETASRENDMAFVTSNISPLQQLVKLTVSAFQSFA